ncbi:MAG: hypothetical protein ABI432_15260 [Flavobacteriales bacterium]
MRICIGIRVLLGALTLIPAGLAGQSNYQLVLDVPATPSAYVLNAIQNPSGSQWILGSTGSGSSAIHKFDPNGVAVWSQGYTSPVSFSGITNMITDAAEGAYCLRQGASVQVEGPNEIDTAVYSYQLAHLTATGAVDWARDIAVKDRFLTVSSCAHKVLHRFSDGSLGLLLVFQDFPRERWNLSRFSAFGELEWSEQIGTQVTSGSPMMDIMQSDPPTLQDDGAGGMFVISTGGTDPLKTTSVIHLTLNGEVDWMNDYGYEGQHDFSNCLTGGLLADGSLATIGYIATNNGAYSLIHRIGTDGTLTRSDLVTGSPFHQAYIKPGPDDNMVIMVGLGIGGGPHVMVISPSGEVVVSNKRRRLTIDPDYVFMQNVGMGLSGNVLTLGGDLMYQDIIFSTTEYRPTLERLDVFGTADDCMWEALPVEHFAVPDNLVSTNANTPYVEDITSLNSSSPGSWSVEALSNINTTELCSLGVGFLEGLPNNGPFVLNNVVGHGEEVLLDCSGTGEVIVFDSQGRMVISEGSVPLVRSVVRTTQLIAGVYQVMWTSSNRDHVKRGRFIVQ